MHYHYAKKPLSQFGGQIHHKRDLSTLHTLFIFSKCYSYTGRQRTSKRFFFSEINYDSFFVIFFLECLFVDYPDRGKTTLLALFPDDASIDVSRRRNTSFLADPVGW